MDAQRRSIGRDAKGRPEPAVVMNLRLPALLIGITLTMYWGRVLRMSYKARQRSGHGANLVPPEPLGRALRLIWAPAILTWIAQPWIIALSHRPPWVFVPLYSF